MIYLIATLKIKPGSYDKVREAVLPCLEATRKEEGCISYDMHRHIEDPETLVFVERWKSQDALDIHFETSHLKAWREQAGPYFISRKIEIIHPDTVNVL